MYALTTPNELDDNPSIFSPASHAPSARKIDYIKTPERKNMRRTHTSKEAKKKEKNIEKKPYNERKPLDCATYEIMGHKLVTHALPTGPAPPWGSARDQQLRCLVSQSIGVSPQRVSLSIKRSTNFTRAL